MRIIYILLTIFELLLIPTVNAQDISSVQDILDKLELLQLNNRSEEALSTLDSGIKSTTDDTGLAYLYAFQSTIYASRDSLMIAKRLTDMSMAHALKSGKNTAIAVAYRARAFLNNVMNLPDEVIKDALEGLKQVEDNEEDPQTKYHLYYLLYGAYSKWDDGEKMALYIQKAKAYAIKAQNINLQVNANNGIASMYLTRYRKEKMPYLLDSSFLYLNHSIELQQKNPDKVSGNTLVITCINLANYYLDHSSEDLPAREQKAFRYLSLAEEKLRDLSASPERWINVLGIKSGFAKKQGHPDVAEAYLLQGLSQMMHSNGHYYKLEYTVNKDLADLATQRNDFKSALAYQQKAEALLMKSFNEQQRFNAQKLEVQYETYKKDKELELLKERETFSRRQQYLYGGIALTLLFGLVFMFISYHFRLRYSVEREKKLAREKEDAEQQAHMQLLLEKEEQARLKAEQALLDLRKQQLEKEALAHSVIIERKNETLRQIQDKMQSGESAHIQKLLKEDMLLQADFEDIRIQVQELHPEFFNRLSEKAIQKLTALDLKYCTYLYLKMSTKQIAQALHVEPQSVRMFKYRLKQKFGLGKEDDLEKFLER